MFPSDAPESVGNLMPALKWICPTSLPKSSLDRRNVPHIKLFVESYKAQVPAVSPVISHRVNTALAVEIGPGDVPPSAVSRRLQQKQRLCSSLQLNRTSPVFHGEVLSSSENQRSRAVRFFRRMPASAARRPAPPPERHALRLPASNAPHAPSSSSRSRQPVRGNRRRQWRVAARAKSRRDVRSLSYRETAASPAAVSCNRTPSAHRSLRWSAWPARPAAM